MSHLLLQTDHIYRGLQLVTLENEFLKVEILPEAGGKIWQVTYLPLGIPVLWNNESIAPASHPIYASYDDCWCGGWDELFPNDEETFWGEERLPDHGELWTGAWDVETSQNEDEIAVILSFRTPITSCLIQKSISLKSSSSRVHISYRLENLSTRTIPYLLKLHPAFRVSEQHRIDFPSMRALREPSFEGTLLHSPLEFEWPWALREGKPIDLRIVPPPESKELYFFYGTELEAGWCAVTDTHRKLSCALEFDPAFFSSAWLFATYGGWQEYEVAVLEPCTGFPLNFQSMLNAGNHRTLQPAESVTTEVTLTLQTGLDSVAGVRPDGSLNSAS